MNLTFFKRIYRSQSYTLQTGRSTANLVNDQRYIFIYMYVYQNQHYSIEGKHIYIEIVRHLLN